MPKADFVFRAPQPAAKQFLIHQVWMWEPPRYENMFLEGGTG